MPLEVQLQTGDFRLGAESERRIRHQLQAIEGRLVHFSDPVARVVLREHGESRRIAIDLRVELGPKGGELVSHQTAETPEHAVRLAIQDVERQLERRLSSQRGEATFGVPSRRLPKQTRPHPLKQGEETEGNDDGEACKCSALTFSGNSLGAWDARIVARGLRLRWTTIRRGYNRGLPPPRACRVREPAILPCGNSPHLVDQGSPPRYACPESGSA